MEEIKEIIKNEPKYRENQIKRVLFFDLIEDWEQATVLSKDLRAKLEAGFSLKMDVHLAKSKSKEIQKALVVLKDGLRIESVLIKHADGRNTVCVSSQVGCSLNCVFCATGSLGFKRNLECWEIISQVLFFARYLKKSQAKVTNVVFMGMGEPFLNYDNVLKTINILNDQAGFNLGARHFSISTAGITEGIEKLSKEKLQINLAISLHAPTDLLRSKLMPINKKYPINSIMKSVDNYIQKTNRRVMLEYLMINGLNDSDECAQKLSRIAKRPLCFINLIAYNPTGNFKPSSTLRIKRFKEILERNGLPVTCRHRFGDEIKAACGQLAGQVKDNIQEV